MPGVDHHQRAARHRHRRAAAAAVAARARHRHRHAVCAPAQAGSEIVEGRQEAQPALGRGARETRIVDGRELERQRRGRRAPKLPSVTIAGRVEIEHDARAVVAVRPGGRRDDQPPAATLPPGLAPADIERDALRRRRAGSSIASATRWSNVTTTRSSLHLDVAGSSPAQLGVPPSQQAEQGEKERHAHVMPRRLVAGPAKNACADEPLNATP